MKSGEASLIPLPSYEPCLKSAMMMMEFLIDPEPLNIL